jgi:hypothetical protein
VKERIGPESQEVYDSYHVVVRLVLADVAAEEDVRSNVDVLYDVSAVTSGFTRMDGRNYLIELDGIRICLLSVKGASPLILWAGLLRVKSLMLLG